MKNIIYLFTAFLILACDPEGKEDLYPNSQIERTFEESISGAQEFWLSDIYSLEGMDLNNDGEASNWLLSNELLNNVDCISYKVFFTDSTYVMNTISDYSCTDYDGVKQEIGSYSSYGRFFEFEGNLDLVMKYFNYKEIKAFNLFKVTNARLVFSVKYLDQEDKQHILKILFSDRSFDNGLKRGGEIDRESI